jgi:hypothetical protein
VTASLASLDASSEHPWDQRPAQLREPDDCRPSTCWSSSPSRIGTRAAVPRGPRRPSRAHLGLARSARSSCSGHRSFGARTARSGPERPSGPPPVVHLRWRLPSVKCSAVLSRRNPLGDRPMRPPTRRGHRGRGRAGLASANVTRQGRIYWIFTGRSSGKGSDYSDGPGARRSARIRASSGSSPRATTRATARRDRTTGLS